ncbi:VOC family protein [Skermania sp. ID1734]|uniref:VOC family protein n=1 Tax=Skermania sp. ID1734 TaxID=2597516 RepID=UPI00117C9B29|nr:VOC family protein [Skermania sp. ID1734]TSD99789.1 VOC family protein [Skermania sp. ID1734]
MLALVGTQVWVHDQDEALEFYTGKLGLELRSDATLPQMGFRWLTVGVPGQDVEIVLMAVPGPPVLDEPTATEIRTLVAKGFAQTMFLATEDCQRTYEELRARGVEFTEPPTSRPYGIDASFRDPSGNSFRLTQRTETP